MELMVQNTLKQNVRLQNLSIQELKKKVLATMLSGKWALKVRLLSYESA